MADSKPQDRLFIVHGDTRDRCCGPTATRLALCWAKELDSITFPVAGGPDMRGRVISLVNMSEWHRYWTPAWAEKGQRWSAVTIELDDDSQKRFSGTKKVTIRYCSGPTAKERWGIFAVGIIKKASENLKRDVLPIFGERFLSGSNFILSSCFVEMFSMLFRESDKSMTKRGKKPSDDNPIKITLDFRTWTLGSRSKSVDNGKWRYERIVCSTDPSEILEQAYKVFCNLLDEEKKVY
ncbi:hypothetical protein KJ786_00630 [Patescibacteria group bacterium]|nr:hypothetical protein [Patescibacteria group bacterium]